MKDNGDFLRYKECFFYYFKLKLSQSIQDGSVEDIYNDTIDHNNYCIESNGTDISAFICTPFNSLEELKKIYPFRE